jgi:hypothetical protein
MLLYEFFFVTIVAIFNLKGCNMKKILLVVSVFLFTIINFTQVTHAEILNTKPYLSRTKQMLAWPTDVLVENYSGQSVTARFITVVSDHTVGIDSYPAANYYAQLLNQYTAYQVRVLIWDYFGHVFFDKNVGSVNRITINRPAKNEKLTQANIVIS